MNRTTILSNQVEWALKELIDMEERFTQEELEGIVDTIVHTYSNEFFKTHWKGHGSSKVNTFNGSIVFHRFVYNNNDEKKVGEKFIVIAAYNKDGYLKTFKISALGGYGLRDNSLPI